MHRFRIASAVAEALEPRRLFSALTTIASFTGANGENPDAPVAIDSSGDIFGTTFNGGADPLFGSVFEIPSGSSTISTVASFNRTNGSNPAAGLAIDSSGDLFGTTLAGGGSGYGEVFEIAHGSHSITIIASFNGANGHEPDAPVTLDPNGNLFGTTESGGANGDGVVFEIAHGTSTITDLATFNSANGSQPQGGVTLDPNGDLFGTTVLGGADGSGVVFEVAHNSGVITDIGKFKGANGGEAFGNLAIDSNGNLFGAASAGGAGEGVVFDILAGTTGINVVATFNNANGYAPLGGITLDADGNLWGTTEYGGAHSFGTIFEIAAGTNTIITRYSFSGSDGSTPTATVTFDSTGELFGTTYGGTGADADGTVFSARFASSIRFVQNPVNTPAGSDVSPDITVLVLNDEGNPKANQSIVLSVDSGPSDTILGTTTEITNSNGIATFGDIAFSTAGTYTLSASDAALNLSQDSASFTITPGAAAKLKFAAQPVNAVAGVAIAPAITVKVKDANGNLDTADNSAVTLTIATGPSTVFDPSSTLTVNAVAGVATFSNVALDTAGDYTLSASDSALTPATSDDFNIVPAAPATLVFVQQPVNTTAGVIMASVIVKLKDAFGNKTTNDASTVTLTVNGPGHATSHSTLAVADSGGEATFSNVVLKTAGPYTLTATDGAASGISGSFTIQPAAPDQINFLQQPTSTPLGESISPAVTVAVLDAFGNVVTTDDTSIIKITINSGPDGAVLSGTLKETDVNGIATFDNLNLDLPGTYTLAASDKNLPGESSISQSFSMFMV